MVGGLVSLVATRPMLPIRPTLMLPALLRTNHLAKPDLDNTAACMFLNVLTISMLSLSESDEASLSSSESSTASLYGPAGSAAAPAAAAAAAAACMPRYDGDGDGVDVGEKCCCAIR